MTRFGDTMYKNISLVWYSFGLFGSGITCIRTECNTADIRCEALIHPEIHISEYVVFSITLPPSKFVVFFYRIINRVLMKFKCI